MGREAWEGASYNDIVNTRVLACKIVRYKCVRLHVIYNTPKSREIISNASKSNDLEENGFSDGVRGYTIAQHSSQWLAIPRHDMLWCAYSHHGLQKPLGAVLRDMRDDREVNTSAANTWSWAQVLVVYWWWCTTWY